MPGSIRFALGLLIAGLALVALGRSSVARLGESPVFAAFLASPQATDCAAPFAVPAFDADDPGPGAVRVAAGAERAAPRGRLLVLPGVANTRFHLGGFVALATERLPGFDIEVRRWGVPLLRLDNLRAYDRNRVVAEAIASEIAAWRLAHREAPLYVLGYSGGGGLAALVVERLPDGVQIDRLFLVAPAISPRFPVERSLLPHVTEFIVNYSSERDLQVGWGTRVFGTIDRVQTESAGAVGFREQHPRLLEWRWAESDRAVGHSGNHLAYLGRRWQTRDLLPALDPEWDANRVIAHWHTSCDGE
jgi:hypothetical protein